MDDYPEKLRMIARRQTLPRDEWERVLLGSADEIERLREALRDIASGKYSGVLLLSHPPKDPAAERARAALGEDK